MDFSKEPYNFGFGTAHWKEDSHNLSAAINYRFNL